MATRVWADGEQSADGFVRGQQYGDTLAEQSAAESAQLLDGFLGRLEDALDNAGSFEAARAALLQVFERETDPRELAELVQHVMMCAQLAGHLAVEEDL